MGGLSVNINNNDSISAGDQSVEKGDLSVTFDLDGKRDVCVYIGSMRIDPDLKKLGAHGGPG